MNDRILELLIDHGVAAIFDNDRAAVVFLNVRQRLHQHIGFGFRVELCIHANFSF